MHLEEGKTGVNRITARIASDREDGADFKIGKAIYRAADYAIFVSGEGSTLDELGEHVNERDPEGAPGVISVDRTLRVVAKPVDGSTGALKPELYPGPLEIVELPPLPENLAS